MITQQATDLYTQAFSCLKCAHDEACDEWQAVRLHEDADVIRRTCRRCGFQLLTLPLDSDSPLSPTDREAMT